MHVNGQDSCLLNSIKIHSKPLVKSTFMSPITNFGSLQELIVYCKHDPLSCSDEYNIRNMMDATSGAENACPSGASEFILVFSEM